MITDPKVERYLDLLDPGNSELLENIRAEALADDVPIMRRGTEALLKTQIAVLRPREILEVGTAVAYSALVMRESAPKTTRITTIENYPPRLLKARENLAAGDPDGRITLIAGDAGEVLKTLPDEHYQMIFMDAAKGQYLTWLPELLRVLVPGGVLITDNVLQEGLTAESRYALDRRDRTIHARMREYLYVLTHSEGITTAVIPTGDGTALTVKGTEK